MRITKWYILAGGSATRWGEYVYISWDEPQCDEQDIDDAWCDYCDYWKAKAMEGDL